jgi:hypothetical protein
MAQFFRTVYFMALFFSITGVLTSCSNLSKPAKSDNNPQKIELNTELTWKNEPFISHSNWLGLAVDFKPAEQLRLQIEQLLKQPLKNRGEAHITIITPPEFENLKPLLSMQEIEKISHDLNLQDTKWQKVCIGQGEIIGNSGTVDKKSMLTFYLVVESPGLNLIRNQIAQTFYKKGGAKNKFDPKNYNPHITIGFTDRDLHESDGVIKNKESCRFELEKDKITK